MVWKIQFDSEGLSVKEQNTLCFAAKELKKYLEKTVDNGIYLSDHRVTDQNGITLQIGGCAELSAVEDPAVDDAIFIDVDEAGKGVIAGSNARSVLIGVYRYLRELGFVFVRPGVDGERYPSSLPQKHIRVCERASSRHRGVCIEGSVFYESMEDMIDWLPKVGMNSYYIQFFVPSIFYRRWYEHEGYGIRNPYLKGEEISDSDIEGINQMLLREIEKRSLLYHAVGHGWTCKPFGLPSTGWYVVDPSIVPDGVEQYFALNKGERKLYGNCPINTSLCYGNPEARKRMVDSVIEYCLENPNVDYLHFWLADGTNNHCECELCKDHRPSDLYVRMLNELDAELTARKIRQKIVFIMYVDLLWAPKEERIKNPDRYMLIFCPIARSYSMALSENTGVQPSEYVRNQLTFPTSAGEYIGFLKEWREAFDGECCVFDYYYMWDCYKDLGYTETARLIHRDVTDYRDFRFTGLISCQGNRTFSPTSLGMNVMAYTLWNREASFEAIRENVLRAEYGNGWEQVRDYLELLSQCSVPQVIRFEKPIKSNKSCALLEKGIAASEAFLKLIRAKTPAQEQIERLSWRLLEIYVRIVILLLNAYWKAAKGECMEGEWERIEDFVNRNEWEMRQYYDVFEFKYTLSRVFKRFEQDAEVK